MIKQPPFQSNFIIFHITISFFQQIDRVFSVFLQEKSLIPNHRLEDLMLFRNQNRNQWKSPTVLSCYNSPQEDFSTNFSVCQLGFFQLVHFFSKYISIHRISLRVNSRRRHDSSFFNKFKAKFLLKTELSPPHLPQGPSINYVVSKSAIFDPPPLVVFFY